MTLKLLCWSRYSFRKYFYSTCSVKDILKSQPVGGKTKLKVIYYIYEINCELKIANTQ